MDTPACTYFSHHYKGKQFSSCLLPWSKKPFQTCVNSYGKEFAPNGANSFLLELNPIEKPSENENDLLPLNRD